MRYTKYFLLGIYLTFNGIYSTAQNCSGCTISVSGQTVLDVNIYPGNTLCIASNGEVLGDIKNYGGTVCNQGLISGDYIQYSGTLNNYGQATSSSQCILYEGEVNNYGIIASNLMTAQGLDITINNDVQLNVAEIDLNGQSLQTPILLNNNGTIAAGSFHADSSLIQNYGSLTTTMNININWETVFNCYGILECSGNFSNNGLSRMYCMGHIGGDLYNNGETTGPPFGCGGFSVDGDAFNNGDFGIGNLPLDLCKTVGSSGFNGSLGTIGPNVTYCSCTNTCSTQTASLHTEQIDDLSAYPNPTSGSLYVSGLLPNTEVLVMDLHGKTCASFTSSGSNATLDVSALETGVYLLRNETHFLRIRID